MASQVVEVLTHSADNFVDNKIFGLVALSDIAAYFEFSEDDRTHLRKQFDDVKSEDDADLNEKQFRKLVCHLCYEENFKSPRGDLVSSSGSSSRPSGSSSLSSSL